MTKISISFFVLKKNSFASFDVKVTAAFLMIHRGAYSSACSCSKVVIEWSGTVVTVFNNAVFDWDWGLPWLICIRSCKIGEKSCDWDDFHIFYFGLEMMEKYLISKIVLDALYGLNAARFCIRMRQKENDRKTRKYLQYQHRLLESWIYNSRWTS